MNRNNESKNETKNQGTNSTSNSQSKNSTNSNNNSKNSNKNWKWIANVYAVVFQIDLLSLHHRELLPSPFFFSL